MNCSTCLYYDRLTQSCDATGGSVNSYKVCPLESLSLSSGLSPDAPVTTNAKGGKQSDVPYAFQLVDAKAMFKLAEVLAQGAKKYERDNWRKIDAEEHLNHLIGHAMGWLGGDRQDDHPGHILARAMMFVAMVLQEEETEDGRE